MSSSQPLILVVDDEESILESVTFSLAHEGYRTETAMTGEEAIKRFQATQPDLVILDFMLPDRSGTEVCQAIRTLAEVPVLFLTARDQLEDKVQAFDSGADDYLAKPFKFKELLVRLRALLRRSGNHDRAMSFGEITLDSNTRRVTCSGQQIHLTLREFQLLELLMRRPHFVYSREQLLQQLWGWDPSTETNVLDVHVSSLRSKLSDVDRKVIRTVRGVGYSLG
jgi:DNA-binding response OmpR family regulator